MLPPLDDGNHVIFFFNLNLITRNWTESTHSAATNLLSNNVDSTYKPATYFISGQWEQLHF